MHWVKRQLIGLGVAGVVLIILGSVLGFGVFPSLIEGEIDKAVWLAQGTTQFQRFIELPFPLTFKVYLFNITNMEDIIATGAKPEVNEVGPYVYNEYMEKKNVKIDYYDNTIEFFQHRRFEFNEKASNGLKENDVLNLINTPMASLQQMLVPLLLSSGMQALLPQADNATQLIFSGAKHPFVTTSVKDYLWDGVNFCNITEIKESNGAEKGLAGMTCLIMSEMGIKNIDKVQLEGLDFLLKFSFMKYKNNTHDGKFVVNTGLEDPQLIGKILNWENKMFTNFWSKEENACDEVKGWDSTIYPPHITEDSEFDIYSTDICRISKLKYASDTEYEGINAMRFEVDRNAFASSSVEPANECYCITNSSSTNLDGEYACQPNGFVDMFGCQGAPVLASFPHMLWGDSSYYDSVIGLSRSESEHLNFVELEPNTGAPLRGVKMAQFNIIMRYNEELPTTTEMFRDNPAVMPLLWVNEGMELPKSLVNELKSSLINVVAILDTVTWVIISLGIVFCVISVAGFLYLKKNPIGDSKTSKHDASATLENIEPAIKKASLPLDDKENA